MAAMVQLVKLWAGAHGMNDATAGTFNSFALTLMVSYVLDIDTAVTYLCEDTWSKAILGVRQCSWDPITAC